MGVSILEGEYDGADGAVLICSTSMVTFGPVFDDGGEAELFLQWHDAKYNEDVRKPHISALMERYHDFHKLRKRCESCDSWYIGENATHCADRAFEPSTDDSLATWLERWEAEVEAWKTSISRAEAEKRYHKQYGRES